MTSKDQRQTDRAAALPVTIRAAGQADAAAIVGLVRALAAHVGDASQATVTAQAMAEAGGGDHPLWRGMVAEAGGTLVGICLYSILYSTWVGGPGLYVIDLFVVPEFRAGQLGRRLLAATARQGRDHGCRFVRLEVDHRNSAAEGFYERLGFQKRTGDTIFMLKGDGFAALTPG